MKTRIFTLTLFLISIFNFAQITISGKVLGRNKKSLKDVSVTLKDTYDGATTDENGNYKFETSEKGNQTLVFNHPKFIEIEKKITIEDKNLTENAELKESVSEIDAVVITAGSIEASDKKRATAVLNPIDIYTTAGANGQISGALTTLPSVQKVGEQEGLFVRGGTGTETKIFFDGMLVNKYFTDSTPGTAGMDRFNTSLFKGNIFSSGGYSALYGQALSSVLILESVDIPEKSSYSFGVSPIFLNANLQLVNQEKTKSYGASFGYFNLILATKFLKWNQEFEKIPSGLNGDFNYRFRTKNNGMVKYYGMFDTGKTAIFRPSLETGYDKDGFGMDSKNTFHNVTWKEKFGKYKLDAGVSFAYNNNILEVSSKTNDVKTKISDIENASHFVNAKVVIDRKINVISAVRAGIESNMSFENTTVSPTGFGSFTRKINENLTSLFAETDLGFSNDFSLKLGARAEHSELLNKWNFAPRAAATYRLSKNWLTSLAFGKFYQNPESKYLPFNTNNNDIFGYQSADHYILQLQRNSEGRNLRFEAFYKNYGNLMKTNVVNYQQTLTSVEGNGYAKGIELFWKDKKSIKNIDYWISYSYLDSERNFLNYKESLFPTFAAKHTLSVVAKKFVTNWKTGLNLAYTYNHGRPWYNFATGEKGLIKDYNALNFSVNYLPTLGKKEAKSFPVLVLSINNILNNKNIYGYNFSNNGSKMAPNLPANNTFVFIGCFISFGIDKTQDAINNNL